MKKLITLTIMIVLSLALFVGCGSKKTDPQRPGEPASVPAEIADAGNTFPQADRTEAFAGTEAPAETEEPFDADLTAAELLAYFETVPHVMEDMAAYCDRNPLLQNATVSNNLIRVDREEAAFRVDSLEFGKNGGAYVRTDTDGTVTATLKAYVSDETRAAAVAEALEPLYAAAGWTPEREENALRAVPEEGEPLELVAWTQNGRLTLRWRYPVDSGVWDVDQDYIYDFRPLSDMAEKMIAVVTAFPEEGETPEAYYARFPFPLEDANRVWDYGFADAERRIYQANVPQSKTVMDGSLVFYQQDEPEKMTVRVYAELTDYDTAAALYEMLADQYRAWFGENLTEQKYDNSWTLGIKKKGAFGATDWTSGIRMNASFGKYKISAEMRWEDAKEILP